jgi:hypothetical protein
VRSHGRIKRSSSPTVQGDGSFQTITGYEIDDPLAPKSWTSTAISAPTPPVSSYLAMATPIDGSTGITCELIGYNLTPTNNSTGSTNANGIYSLDPGGREVVIENLHLKGTLIIHNSPGSQIIFRQGLWIEPGPLNYPVLLLTNSSANTYIQPSQGLNEANSGATAIVQGLPVSVGTDYNENGLAVDAIPNTPSINGIIWASSSSVTLGGGGWPFRGSLINRAITVEGSVVLGSDVQLQNSLAPGFVGTGMRLTTGNFRDAP